MRWEGQGRRPGSLELPGRQTLVSFAQCKAVRGQQQIVPSVQVMSMHVLVDKVLPSSLSVILCLTQMPARSVILKGG